MSDPLVKPPLVGSVARSASISVTRPNDTTAYAALDVIGTAATAVVAFAEAAQNQGASIIILGASLRIDAAAIPSGMSGFRLHLYNDAPTAIADNAAFDLPSGDRAKYLGYIDFPTPSDLGATLWSEMQTTKKVQLADGATTIYGILQTSAAYTPTAQVVKTITLETVQA